ncbi:telomere stability and silencing-domain-containing protein [Dichotomocladium elegans]|nr:telomere stability and silencing-domain-containing protein [Dichotomocladium elegans]
MFGGRGPLCLSFEPTDDHTIQDLKVRLEGMTHIDMADQRISTLGGRPLQDDDLLFGDPHGPLVLNLSLRLRGGKGGFGSMLRAQGGRMNAQKTTNFEACRDLQGRRIRTVNENKRREEALAALPEIEREREERIQKKIEEGLKEREPKKFRFDDNQFLEDREEVIESVKSAVSKMLKQQQPAKKAKVTKSPPMTSMFDDEISEDDDNDDDEEDDDDDNEEADSAEASDARNSKETTHTSNKQETTKSATSSGVKDKGKGKASVRQQESGGKNDNDDSDDDDEKKDPKKILSEFMDANYGDEYDSEEDEDFVDDEEESSSEDNDDEEDFDAEEEENEERTHVKAESSSSSQDKGKGKQTRKRKEREE